MASSPYRETGSYDYDTDEDRVDDYISNRHNIHDVERFTDEDDEVPGDIHDDEEQMIVDVNLSDSQEDHGDKGNATTAGRRLHVSSNRHQRNDPNNTAAGDDNYRWRYVVAISMVLAFSIGVAVPTSLLMISNNENGGAAVPSSSPQHAAHLDDKHKPRPWTQTTAGGTASSSGHGHFGNGSENFHGTTTNNNNAAAAGQQHENSNAYHNGPPSIHENEAERKRHFTKLVVEISGAVAVAAGTSPARKALDWILYEDPYHLTTSDRILDVEQRYVAAVFYFATLGEHWSSRKNQKQDGLHSLLRQRQRRRQRKLQQDLHEDLHDLPSNNNSRSGGGGNHTSAATAANPANFLTNNDVCHWKTPDNEKGIFCDGKGRIVKLGFRNFGLGGTLPREIGYLRSLGSIDIENNDIEGSIPTQYGYLVNLQSMNFERNLITGTMPSEIGNLGHLLKLDLDGNNLTGSLPTEIGFFEKIEKIELGGSSMTGTIPKELFDMNKDVKRIDLKYNQFSGNIPLEFGALTKLTYLNLEMNNFIGTVPAELSNTTSLTTALFNGNDLTGGLDAAFCSSNPNTFDILVADCLGPSQEVECSCCTSCCKADGNNCAKTTVAMPTGPISLSMKPTEMPSTKPVAAPDLTVTPSMRITAAPIELPPQDVTPDSEKIEKLKGILATVSDINLLETRHTNQFKAFMWMAKKDPAPMNLDTTPRRLISQKYIMTLMYVSTNGRDWKKQNSYLSDSSLCDWGGLKCDDAGDIVSIDLEKNNLNGTLVSELGALGPSLSELRFGSNALRGGLPSELGMLSGLETLDVFDNPLVAGDVPSELSAQSWPNIEKIKLVGTSLTGNLDSLFCTSNDADGDAKIDISANCFDKSVTCTCCTVCCDAKGDNCRAQ